MNVFVCRLSSFPGHLPSIDEFFITSVLYPDNKKVCLCRLRSTEIETLHHKYHMACV